MKTVTLSNRFCYRELDEQDAQAIKNDLVLFNKVLRKAYKLLSLKFQGIPWDFESLQKEMKRLYNTNDYFPLSVIWKAKHILKCNYEQHKKAVQQIDIEKGLRAGSKKVERYGSGKIQVRS